MQTNIEGGLVDPVVELQAGFRAIMNAMAQPGSIHLRQTSAHPPQPLTPLAALAALTLCDHDTTLWLDSGLNTPAVRNWLGFHCGASIVDDLTRADFAIISDTAALDDLASFKQGEQDYPDRSATLIVQMEAFSGGSPLRLEGPGIESFTLAAPRSLNEDFIEQWSRNQSNYPLGIDLILSCPEGYLSIPRTTRVTAWEA